MRRGLLLVFSGAVLLAVLLESAAAAEPLPGRFCFCVRLQMEKQSGNCLAFHALRRECVAVDVRRCDNSSTAVFVERDALSCLEHREEGIVLYDCTEALIVSLLVLLCVYQHPLSYICMYVLAWLYFVSSLRLPVSKC